jgi:hypothetical protein
MRLHILAVFEAATELHPGVVVMISYGRSVRLAYRNQAPARDGDGRVIAYLAEVASNEVAKVSVLAHVGRFSSTN